ncbi:MAG: type II CRISPR-associated endonuclease Cas1 [Oscillospiraceae bacterium]|nr:type II CRISPR-associated endonuclease Cas1 [Oscillospiraceae bacterium]
MAYRNIFISSPAKLSLKNEQLIVKTQEEYSFPLEDVSTILIENAQVTVTGAFLSRCAQGGVLVYLCDNKHLPCGVLTGYHNHSRQHKMLQAQIDLRQTVKKHLWQKIVTRKIENQAQVLSILNLDGCNEILSLSKKVKLDDVDNIEAVAASQYFRYMFGEGFSRGQENIINARLNYGYAIVRGLVCRSLVVYGLEPSLGVHHDNQLNAFNLADDIMEVYRPVVDLCVYQMEDNGSDVLSVKDKQILFNLINCDVVVKKQKHPLSYGIEKTVQSLQSALLSGKNTLEMCEIVPLQQHEYE